MSEISFQDLWEVLAFILVIWAFKVNRLHMDYLFQNDVLTILSFSVQELGIAEPQLLVFR